MSEKILSIHDVENIESFRNDYARCDGFEIKTTARTIQLLIGNEQSCCENWGYFMSEDNLYDFIGAELLDIKVVDEFLKAEQFIDVYYGGVMFVNLETTSGVLQFVAYNSHNGYYGHSAYLVSNDVIVHDVCL